MSARAEFENNVISDLVLFLKDQGITTQIFPRKTVRDNNDNLLPDVVYPSHAVGFLSNLDSLPAGQTPSGYQNSTVTIDTLTYLDDDKDKEDLGKFTGDVREAILQDDLQALLTALSNYNEYLGFIWGSDENEDDEKIQMTSLIFNLHYSTQFKPLSLEIGEGPSLSEGYVSFGSNFYFQFDDPFSIKGWINATDGILIGHGGTGPTVIEGIKIFDSDNLDGTFNLKFRIGEAAGVGSELLEVTVDKKISYGTWFYLAITKDNTGTAAGLKIYIDKINEAFTIVQDDLTVDYAETETFHFGAPGSSKRFNVTNFDVIDRVLTQSEINEGVTILGKAPANPNAWSFTPDNFYEFGGGNDTASLIEDVFGSIDGTPVNIQNADFQEVFP